MPKLGERKNLIGQRFGRLVVEKIDHEDYDKRGYFLQYRYLCRCDCGGTRIIPAESLKSGRANSCGCLHTEELLRRNYRHGMSKSALFIRYYHIKNRCYNPNSEFYHCYGGRGIKMCPEWLGENGLINFAEWALKNGFKENLTIDRINNDGDYAPDNCRWTTNKIQSNNRNNNVHITFNGETHTISEWSDIVGIRAKTLYNRRKQGWSVKDMLTRPVMGNGSK